MDPTGLDWYIYDDTGALQWYNGRYDDDDIPEGYSYLGDDSFFGEQSEKDLGYYKSKNIESFNLTADQSQSLASSYGFAKVDEFTVDKVKIEDRSAENLFPPHSINSTIEGNETVVDQKVSYSRPTDFDKEYLVYETPYQTGMGPTVYDINSQ